MGEQDENRARLRRALEEKGVSATPRADPFAPAGPRPWQWQDAFTPRGLSAAGREGARFFGDEVFAPVGRVFRDGANTVGRSFNEWNANRERRDMIDADLERRYMPQIRASNERTLATMRAEGDLRRREDALPEDYERSNAFLRGRLESVIHPWAEVEPNAYPQIGGNGRRLNPPGAPYQAPETLTDDELYAEYEALNRERPR